MLFETFKFELQYRLKRPATYIYFFIFFLFCFLAVTVDDISIGGGTGQVKENAPVTITNMMLLMSAFFMLITSSIMGVPIVRDFEHQTESLIFVNPIKKRDYLFGRFLGSFVVLLFVNMGMMLGFMLGDLMPFRDASKMVDFNLWSYVQPFFVFVIPNLLFTGGLFFATGALSRKMILVYTQGIVLLVLYIVSLRFTRDLESTTLASLLDSFGINTVNLYTQYWTVTEQNTMVVPLEGVVLYNRLIWGGLGILSLAIAYFGFSFNVVRSSVFGKKKVKKEESKTENKEAREQPLPTVNPSYGFTANIYRVFSQSLFYFRSLFKEIPFLAIVICGMLMMFLASGNLNRMYGTHAYPTTYSVLELIDGFNLFFLIILVVYAGELVWKERTVKMNLIYDAMPIPDFIGLISKFFGLILSYVVLLLVLIGCGIIIQTYKGYYSYELPLYFGNLFSGTLSFLVLYTLLSFFIQVMVNHKYIGYALMVVFFITIDVLADLGLAHGLFQFADISMGTYSDMNGYGHFLTSFSWFDLYWFAFTMILFAISIMFASRGAESMMKIRWKIGKMRLSKQLLTLILTSTIAFTMSGCYIYYNTNVKNEYINNDDREESQANYEKTLKKYESLNQPKITQTYLEVDIEPSSRNFSAKGYYYLKNKSEQSIKNIHLQFSPEPNLKIKEITFEGGSSVNNDHKEFKYFIYSLNESLASGDSVKLNFQLEFITDGFVESNSNTSVVNNGTFFNNTYFPSLGYNEGLELSDKSTREDYDLAERPRARLINDPIGKSMNFFGNDADHIDFEIVMSTEKGQTAIAPGYLQKQWDEEDRSYFHYKMDVPMINFYSMISANYEKMQDTWDNNGKPVNLEIYYHKGHEYNLDRMMNSMKTSLAYYSKNFSPYQFRQMRIMEFPRYASFAQSFANTVPFSEGIGFMLDIKEDDVDMAYYVTAHEMAHQWWGHQLAPGDVQGSAMLSETLSQYSALMVMKQVYSEEQMQKFLKHELDRYLRGRASEQVKEMPLMKVESQSYIHYRKGSLIMYALQDYIGEDSVNAALKGFMKDWAFRSDVYPSTEDLMPYLKAVTPSNMQYLFADMFENITLYENKTEEARYTKIDESTYEVALSYSAKKLLSDSLGLTQEVPMNDLVDIGIYGKAEEGKEDKLLYLQKHKIVSGKGEIKIIVSEEPTKAGIDPINKLIDRTSDDNTKSVELKEVI